ncbi:radical SAM protein [Streptacidiphilus sp. P02-A3a]|uniref:radical SAM protein n=1 Tax=Streptacidiphilus sp. P02-A3a TaxID=2704468 RepID=UPI0015FA7B34|nr:radical SAM protein [Streptacidiphilus sp. P02-A3a]QMU73311.1 radical SAM protein [Streptacidiphilus sp. P02-A3a]
MHELIASPFLDEYLLVRPGARGGLRLPQAGYEELRTHPTKQTAPTWFSDAVRSQWTDLDVAARPAAEYLLVREPSGWGYSRASWEINLGCNYQCKHCYLGLKVNSGMPLEDKLRCLDIMAQAGVLWLQITGGEPTVDRDFMHAYRYAFALGMMITVSTNGSLLWRENLLALFRQYPPYRVTVSMYGANKHSYDELTQRQGAWDLFIQGMNAARRARLPLRMSVIVTEDNADEEQAMIDLCEGWGLEYNVFTNMTPTIYGGAESLTAQSKEHLRLRKPFSGCNAGHTFFHTDPHGLVSICKIGRDAQISLPTEGIDGLARLGAIADRLMLRTGGCSGCQLSGSCTVCRPLAKHYQEAKAPLSSYCQHGIKKAG